MKYRKKPVVIEAAQFTISYPGASQQAINAVYSLIDELGIDGDNISLLTKGGFRLQVKTKEGYLKAKPGDWIIKGVEGEIYPCDDSIFRKTYEEYEP